MPALPYLCFTAEEANSTVALVLIGDDPTQGQSFEISTDGSAWSSYILGDEIILANVGDKVYWKGDNTTITEASQSGTTIFMYSMTGTIAASGNIMSLLDSTCQQTSVPDYCFVMLFGSCPLTTAPELPATTLGAMCYGMMFAMCPLTIAPALPSRNLAEGCYNQMFSGCSLLTTAPELPATTLAEGCYTSMFQSCESLTTAPELPAINLADKCYESMFQSCYALTTAPNLPATTLATECYCQMFTFCTSLRTAPALPATTLADGCYRLMFEYCDSLITAPALPATRLADYCYYRMFKECTSLTTAPSLPATTLFPYCYSEMFYWCTSLTTAPELPATTLADYCYQLMFYYCRSLVSAPSLPATTLVNNCYQQMFQSCESLTTAPNLPATTLATSCYQDMFTGCSALTTAPALPATTLAEGCYRGMFTSCTSLTTAPELPATTLAEGCYGGMFYTCTSLKVYSNSTSEADKAWRIPTEGNASEYTTQTNMFVNTIGDYSRASSVNLNTTFYTQNTPVPPVVKCVNAVYKADGTKIMDITDSTVVANKMAGGTYAYNAAGEKISGSLVEQATNTITPSTSQQTAVLSGKYTTGDVVVSAIQTEEKTVTVNGDVTPTSGKYLTKVIANVPTATIEQNKNVTPTTSQQVVTPSSGYDAMAQVTVSAIQTETKTATGNGTVSPTSGKYLSSVTVAIPEEAGKTITPSTSQQTAVASGKLTTGNIIVSAIQTETKTVTSNGATVTPTSGKYLSQVTVAVPTYDGSVS